MYLVQTVSSRGRPWSSYTDIRTRESELTMYGVQSANNNDMYSPLLARRPAGTSYELPEKETKKEKKWSFGSIFRRKKKNASESSSEEENGKMSFLQRRKRKSAARKKPTKVVGKFDVVVPQGPRGTYSTLNGCRDNEDPIAIFSDPTHDASRTSMLPRQDITSNQYLNVNYLGSDRSDVNVSRNSLASVDSISRKNRKELAKARAEARRENLKYETSSDEESQRSGSSAAKFRSDESLSRYSSLSRRSRGARTERYLRRLSKEEEFKDQKLSKSDVENGRFYDSRSKNRSPLRNFTSTHCNPVPCVANYTAYDPSGMLTIPPSHNNSKRNRNFTVDACCFNIPATSNRNVESKTVPNTNHRSLSYESNMDKHSPPCEVVYGRLPLGIHTKNGTSNGRTPPLPPPRDPRRIVTITAFDSSRPNSFCFETATESKNGLGIPTNRSPLLINDKRKRNATDITGMYSNFRSSSQDQIPIEPVVHSLTVRPASTTPDASQKHHIKDNNDYTVFLADSHPRSRKPLNIQPFNKNENTNVSNLHNGNSKAHQTFNFWKQKENEVKRHKSEPITKLLPKSPVVASRSLSNEDKNDIPQSALLVSAISKSPIGKIRGLPRESSPFRPISPASNASLNSLHRSKSASPGLNAPIESLSEKSSSPNVNSKKPENLEDALNELEEIYNSLRLGDEDLLDRAEKREADICKEVANNISNKKPKRKRSSRRSADIKEDDLAFRKYNKERSKTVGDPHSVTSAISYLLASPLSGDLQDDPPVPQQRNKKEPDVTFDDLVYRSIKQTNNSLKVLDPQPPFGIPIGPISSAPNSDYLHANPEPIKSERVSKKIPDIVKDDLAYRSLRKDSNKEPALPPCSPVGDANNNKAFLIPLQKYNPNNSFRRKRAVRSLSANIFNLMQKEIEEKAQNELEIAKSLTEIADAMELTRQMLKEQEKNISAKRKGFVSDGEAIYTSEHSPSLEAMKRNRANFLNEMKSSEISKLSSNPLNGELPKDRDKKTEELETESKTLDELLTALAVETRETSDRITNELRMLGEDDIFKSGNSNKHKDRSTSVSTNAKLENDSNNKIDEISNVPREKDFNQFVTKDLDESEGGVTKTSGDNNLVKENEVTNPPINDTFPEIDPDPSQIPVVVEEISLKNDKFENEEDKIPTELITRSLSNDSNDKADYAKMCEKLLSCVVESAEIVTDDVESDHVQQILLENVEDLSAEKSVANIVITPEEGSALASPNPIEAEVHSEPDYENLKCRNEDEDESGEAPDFDNEKCRENEKDPDEVIEGKSLKKETEIEEKANDSKNETIKINEDANKDIVVAPKEGDKGETNALLCVAYDNLDSIIGPARVLVNAQPATVLTNDFTTSTTLHLPSNSPHAPYHKYTDNDEVERKVALTLPLDSLKSPNLVKAIDSSSTSSKSPIPETNSRHNHNTNFISNNSTSRPDSLHETKGKPEYGNRIGSDDNSISNNLRSSAAWYESPTSIALACCYGIACTYHLTSLDVVVLGLLFLIASILVSILSK